MQASAFSPALLGLSTPSGPRTTSSALTPTFSAGRRASQFHHALPAEQAPLDCTELAAPPDAYLRDTLDATLDLRGLFTTPTSATSALTDALERLSDAAAAGLTKTETPEQKETRLTMMSADVDKIMDEHVQQLVMLTQNEIIGPAITLLQSEFSASAEEACTAEHARYLDCLGKLNAMLRAGAAPSLFSRAATAEEKFETDRFEKFHISLEGNLERVDATRRRIETFKMVQDQLATRISEDAESALRILGDAREGGRATDTQLDEMFATIGTASTEQNKKRLIEIDSEIKTQRTVLSGLLESIQLNITECYPAPDLDWNDGVRSHHSNKNLMKDYSLDKKLDILGAPSAATGDRWIAHNQLYVLVNSAMTNAILPSVVRAGRQRSATNVHWQPYSLADWRAAPTKDEGFHPSKLIHTKEYYYSQNVTMWIKARTAHDDIVDKALSGLIMTNVGGKEITSSVEENDFVMLVSYFLQYHMQQGMSDAHLLTMFYYSMGEAFKATEDIAAETHLFRKKLQDAKRCGIRVSFNGSMAVATPQLIDRHASFVDYLRDFRDCPADVDPNDVLPIMENYLGAVERGARRIKDIPRPSAQSARGGQRFRALVADIDGTKPPSEKLSEKDASGDFRVICQAQGCENTVGKKILAKMKLTGLVNKGIQPHSVLCDNCVNKLHTTGSQKMKGGHTRKANSRSSRKMLAALGKITLPDDQNTAGKRNGKKRGKKSDDDDDDTQNNACSTDSAGSAASAKSQLPAGAYVPLEKALEWRNKSRSDVAGLSMNMGGLSAATVVSDADFDRLMEADTAVP